MIKPLSQLRKVLKPLGFKIKTQSLSFGRYATFVHIETTEELTFNVFSEEQRKRWQPLFELGKTEEYAHLAAAVKEEDGLIGLNKIK